MSEPTEPKPAPAAAPPAQDEDVLFKMQVAAGEWFARNWSYGVPLIGAALLGSLVYGVWKSWNDGRLAEGFDAVARVDAKAPERALFPDPTKAPEHEASAARYLETAGTLSGSPAAVAYLKAAESFTLAQKSAEARAAVEKAVALKPEGLVGYAAESALAAARLDAGESDAAMAAYRDISGRYEGFYAQSALERLAAAQEANGKTSEAQATRAEIATRFGGAAPVAVDALSAPTEIAGATGAGAPAAPSGTAAPAAPAADTTAAPAAAAPSTPAPADPAPGAAAPAGTGG